MRISQLRGIVSLAALSLSATAIAGGCKLAHLGDLPVDMQGARPLVWAKINGVKARFMLDSGAYYSILSRDAAAQYQLSVDSISGYMPRDTLRGAGGDEKARFTTVKSFGILGGSVPNLQFLVIDESFGSNLAGLLGQNVLRLSDVEYDLANGVLRFFEAVGCGQQPLAYWAVNTPYSSVELRATDRTQPNLLSTATVNGRRISVMFDTGAPRSYLSLDAAARAGITPNSPGVTLLGLTGGIGPASEKVWSATVDTFQLGGEKVRHARLLIANIDPQHQVGEIGGMPDMLLGEDFFLSHRIYVAYSQRKLYFTYNGGPLFNLNIPQVASGAAKPPAIPTAASQARATTAGQPESDVPTDADGFRRRGMAFASMREFDRALADLTRACDLDPRDMQSHYERAVIYMEDGQFKPALQDFNTALTLQPDDIQAHIARAELLQSHPDADPTDATPDIKSDLDAVSRLATPAAGERLTVGVLYGKLGDYPEAIDQIDQWLSHHPLKGDQVNGLNSLCWVRAAGNRDLREALDDCNRALDLSPHTAEPELGTMIGRTIASDDPDILDSRALVYLRLGRPEDAIHDYSSALRINPKMPTSLYGRGLAELRVGEKPQAKDDLAAAAKLDGNVARYFAKMGLAP